ncbi:MAG: hypothetical protein IT428_08890 [Planctomycetaceae bacterium]|nr:hypothetical protein [Planctomycetaceae bacterium]
MSDSVVEMKRMPVGPLTGAIGFMLVVVLYFGCYAAMVERVEMVQWCWPSRIVPTAHYHVPFRPQQQLSPEFVRWADSLLLPAHWADRRVHRETWQEH